MTERRPAAISHLHLARKAVIYIRQSTPRQVKEHTGSTTVQRHQTDHARCWGWPETAIEVIDDDLGLSGSTGNQRPGWTRLLRMVANQEVGIILVSDASRLARRSKYLEDLLELCETTGTLIAVDGHVVDLDDPQNAFLVRVHGSIAQLEVARFVRLAKKTRRRLAKEGHAVSHPPTGYVVAAKGQWVKDPDPLVRERITLIFDLFTTYWTKSQVLRHLARHELQLPIRVSHEVTWVRPTLARISYVLRNPAFAGFYVFNRRPPVKGACVNGIPVDRRHKTTWDDWVVFPDHHDPYVSLAEWQLIQDRLNRNEPRCRRPPGTGPALCQGLMRCGQCGRRMLAQYYKSKRSRKTGTTYACRLAHCNYGEAKCWSLHGGSVDATVTAELLRRFDAPGLEAVLKAIREVNVGYEARRRQREIELDRARRTAQFIRKQLDHAVNHEYRHAYASLANDLDRALQEVERLERREAQEPLTPPLEVTPDVVERIRRLATDVPALWAAPSTTMEERKALVRLFITEVRALSASTVEFDIAITWIGGAVTRHTVVHPWAGGALARQLAAQGWTYAQIADELNRRGILTHQSRRPYSALGVRSLLLTFKRNERKVTRRKVWRDAASVGAAGVTPPSRGAPRFMAPEATS